MVQSPGEAMMGTAACPGCGRIVQRRRDFTLRKHTGCDFVESPAEAFDRGLREAALLVAANGAGVCECGSPTCIRIYVGRDGLDFDDLNAAAIHEPSPRLSTTE